MRRDDTGPIATAPDDRRAQPQPRRDPRGGRAVLVFALVVLLELIVVIGIAAWALAGARTELVEGRRHAADGRDALADFDLVTAQQSFDAAQERFAAGRADLGNPAVNVLEVVPFIGPNLRTTEALAVSGELVAAAAGDVLAEINSQPDGLAAYVPSDGRFPVDEIADLGAVAATAEQQLADAVSTVDTAPRDGLVGPVADARAQLEDQVVYAHDLVGSAARASRALSSFLGVDGRKRYLFGAQNPAELRGTGGFVGAYALATFDGGRFNLSAFRPVQDLTSLPYNEVPAPNIDYAARYSRWGGAGFWQAINATPDFPSAATAMVRLYERTEDEKVDGVVLVDPFVLEALLRLVGDVRIPELGRVGPDEVVSAISVEARSEFDTVEERKETLGQIAGAALRRLLRGGGGWQPKELLDTFEPVMRDRHVLLYSSDAETEQALRDLGFAGALPQPEHDAVAVIVNNAAVNKVDFYMNRTVDYRVKLRPDGSATARLRVTFANGAPPLPADSSIGRRGGDNFSLVSVFCGRCAPTRADPRIVDANLRKGMVIEEELDHTVATTLLTTPRGAKRTIELRWRLDDAWDPAGDGCYRLDYAVQPTIRPTRLSVAVTPPDGYVSDDGRTDGQGGRLHSGPAAGLAELATCYAPGSDA
jgi:hypothetical protein